MKIEDISISRMRNDEYFQYHTEVRDLIVRFGADALNIGKRFNEVYLPLYAQLDDVLKKISKSAHTEKIRECDALRDDMCIGINEISRTYLRHFDPQTRESARRIRIVMDTYGNIARKPLNEQTSAVYNLLQELQGAYSADVAATGITPWVERLDTLNREFDALVKERYDESAAKTDATVKNTRREMDEAYRNICDIVNVFAMVEGGETYRRFTGTLNVIIAKYSAAMAQRAGRKNN